MKTKPNSTLPNGGELIPVTRVKTGTWREMAVDARVERNGICWYRVKGGMGERGDREDWIAAVPGIGISVHDYHYNGEDFGPNHGTFDNACLQEALKQLEYAKQTRAEKKAELANLESGISLLETIPTQSCAAVSRVPQAQREDYL